MKVPAVAHVHTDSSREELGDGCCGGGVQRHGRPAYRAAAVPVSAADLAGVHGRQHGAADGARHHQPRGLAGAAPLPRCTAHTHTPSSSPCIRSLIVNVGLSTVMASLSSRGLWSVFLKHCEREMLSRTKSTRDVVLQVVGV